MTITIISLFDHPQRSIAWIPDRSIQPNSLQGPFLRGEFPLSGGFDSERTSDFIISTCRSGVVVPSLGLGSGPTLSKWNLRPRLSI